ncbi:MAG: prepilin-type N-terminal cleavage/methylation domain-containing protein [Candidatus Omnitrophica bacterium]|nr:prepilin-type N-terminal cleavage/methylation domain-containing protein [Candidatus Omnitrophota bacterium]MBU1925336.1 prepilin-type N-terminal cleavage/methylation domain-containing protein [Candidatus Omnitrophota bacterium]MBU2062945.1 prepilin-type N-terminal cleavage/methylation domain-containing protein [Candidatus Omnitrophota bacterium]
MRNGAFTLIELLITCIILGILVTIAVPTYNRAVERSKYSQAIHNLKTLRQAELAYFIDTGEFTEDWAALDSVVNAASSELNSSNDWSYDVATGTSTFSLTATREGSGAHSSQTITLDKNDSWTGRDNWE